MNNKPGFICESVRHPCVLCVAMGIFEMKIAHRKLRCYGELQI